MKDIENTIRMHALNNAVKYNGKANPKSIIGMVIKEHPEAKDDMESISALISQVVGEVNSMPLEAQISALKELAPKGVETKREKKEGLKDLPGAKHTKVVTRFAPSPSGPMHIGHCYPLSLNYEYSKKYDGKFLMRIEDTNPSNIDPDAYEMIKDEASWLCENNVSEFIIQSDRLDMYYSYCERLIGEGFIYICTCDPESFRDLTAKMEACPCRELDAKENLKRWKMMFTSYKQGDAVARFKTDIRHKNPAMRDFPVFRINEEKHPRKGNEFRVWPLMNFSVSIDDYDTGVTHTLRAKEHLDNAKKQEFIHNALGVPTPKAVSVGRINFKDLEVSCSKTKEKIRAGMFSGWDDIRLPFVSSLRRRGYQPEALRKYAVSVGVTMNDKTVSEKEFFKTINFFNKEIIEPIADRFFFIPDPVSVEVVGAPDQEIELDLHPDRKKGGRKFSTNERFLVSQEDMDSLEEKEICRFMDCLNFRKEGNTCEFDSTDYKKYKEHGKKIIHWLPDSGSLVDVEVMMPDGSTVRGKGEEGMKSLKPGDIVQLERFGFARLDDIDDRYIFWFAHK